MNGSRDLTPWPSRVSASNLSRGLFEGYLRTNVRTLESWEHGRAKQMLKPPCQFACDNDSQTRYAV